MAFVIHRVPRVDPPAGGGLRAGAARIELTPRLGAGLAGHGPTSNAAQGCFGRLYASILVIEDDAGTRAALIAADLHAGSRYLSERLGARLADVGLTVDRIVLAASHTHRGPASILGNQSYDRLSGPAWAKTGWTRHFDQPLADDLADRIEAGVRAVFGAPARSADLVTLRPCVLALTAPTLWGWLTNRSGSALDGSGTGADPDDYLAATPPALDEGRRRALGQRISGSAPPAWIGRAPPPGEPAFRPGSLHALPATPQAPVRTPPPSPTRPGTLDELVRRALGEGDLQPVLRVLHTALKASRRPFTKHPTDAALVDARLHVLIAREPHPTGRGVGPPIGAFAVLGGTPSLIGARHAVFSSDATGHAVLRVRQQLDVPFPFGVAGGALGDVNLVPRGVALDDVKSRARHLDGSAELVREVGQAVGDALLHALRDQPLTWVDDLALHVAWDELDPAAVGLDPNATLGAPSLGGSELASSPFADLLAEGLRETPPQPGAQAPKASFPPLSSGPPLPLRKLTLRGANGPWWTLVGAPVEVSAALSADLRDAATGGTHPATIVGPCGEFASYAGTRWEYTSQSYEAASTLYGRATGEVLAAHVATLAARAPTGTAKFTGQAGSLPLRLGSRGERRNDRPNPFCADVALHGSSLEDLRQHGRPQVRVQRVGDEVRLRASFDGGRPDRPVWDGPFVTIGRVDASRTRLQPFLLPNGLPADDRHLDALIWADVQDARTRWSIEVRCPVSGPVELDRVGLYLHAPLGIPPGGLDARGTFPCLAP